MSLRLSINNKFANCENNLKEKRNFIQFFLNVYPLYE